MAEPLQPEPADELVAIAWVASIPGFNPAMVNVQLPPDTGADGQPAPWAGPEGTGFCTVAAVGGGPDPMLPVSKPVMQVDCWAVVPGSGIPPWGIARALSRAIVSACWDRVSTPRPLLIRVEGVTYPPAAVQAATVPTTPRRAWDDAGDMARYTLDLHLTWIALRDEVA